MGKTNLTPFELRAKIGEICGTWDYGPNHVDHAVDQIKNVDDRQLRLEQLKAVYYGMLDTERSQREKLFSGTKNGSGQSIEHWGTARVSPWNQHPSGPLVGCSLGAPPCRFDRIGAPELDYAAMRFIVSSRENFEWLLKMAAKAVMEDL